MLFFLGLAVLLVILVVVVVFLFNRLTGLRNLAESAWSDIAVQLERRHDLIGNLVETVRGYAAHERRTLEEVVELRNQAMGATEAGRAAAAGEAEDRLTGPLRSLFALAEAYPDLKASSSFGDLQRSLIEVEDGIQNARRYYNAVVRDLNTRVQSFPDLLVARVFGFREREFFELRDPSEAAAPSVAL